MEEPVIREARISDRKPVIEFTQGTFSWGDYIERVFDKWIADRFGKLLVAEVNGAVIGLSFVKLTKKGEVWLQGGRVDKNYRGKGIGKAMIKECLRIAKEEMRASVARLIIDKVNSVAQNVATNQGFKKMCEFIELERKAEHVKDASLFRGVKVADVGSTPRAWLFARSSPIFKKSGGLYTVRFVWYSLDEEDFRQFSSQGKTLVYEHAGKIHGVMLFDESGTEVGVEKSVQSCYLDSDSSAGIRALSSFLVNHAADKGLETVKLWTYSDKEIIHSLKEIGFKGEEDESTGILYFKRL
nr:GNAT family N-acetyltransferase [Candidatus Njordarchaeum guaymaensis]